MPLVGGYVLLLKNEWWRLKSQLVGWGLVKSIVLEQSHGLVFLLINTDSKFRPGLSV